MLDKPDEWRPERRPSDNGATHRSDDPSGEPDAPGEPDASGQARGRKWRRISRTRTYELVIDQIEEQILSGRLRVGDRLPAERELAAMLGVSRPAVREAIRALEGQGVVHSAVGTGPDAGTVVAASSSEALTRLLRLHVGLASFPLNDVVEARAMLERWSVALAARHATSDALERMAELLARMENPAVERAAFNDLDTQFHVAIADAGGNRLIADMTRAIRESLRHPLLAAFEEFPDWTTVADELRAQHRLIYDAVAAGDAEAAAAHVEGHIRGFYARMRPVLPAG